MASQDVELSKFEADFKQQQSEMTNKIHTVLKAIIDQMVGALLSNMVKNPKLNVNSTTSVLSAYSYPTKDPQCSTHIHGSITPSQYIPGNKGTPMTISRKKIREKRRTAGKISIPTPPRHPIH
ncbi:hypothetical protein Tco_0142633, partial [Tanacetum coccineum]